MIPVQRLNSSNEPSQFDDNCRQPGNTWLSLFPDNDPHSQSAWWSQFQTNLADHFSHRCGWLAMNIGLSGHVDHYLACGNRKGKPSPHRHLAFEWSNYRYADGRVNSRKGNLDGQILDPSDVQAGWFEVVLPNFVLKVTGAIPPIYLARAEFTVRQLKLYNGHTARWTRWSWYRRYWNNGSPNVAALMEDAPLVAEAVQRAIMNGDPLPDPTQMEPKIAIKSRKYPYVTKPRTPKTPPDTSPS